ncbi:armadillo repeat-containing protein 5-like, partial [Pogonomyrmex barbatus]|uniref:Armadillo repeat-containing protein 5-like n=1 Tax=Pogonomyrmex barbatus TaxID=144034 RepID=A0A6I9WYM2_9HYME
NGTFQVKRSKIGFNVVLIIKNLDLDEKLHCRACRLISNLCKCSWHAKELCNAGVLEALTVLLMSKIDRQTYCMAIRAIRNIWTVYEKIRETMVELKIIELVTQLFVMAEKKSIVDIKYAELVDACLKAMCAFLVTLDPRCGKQMHVNKNMWGYKCLMRCCSAGNNKIAVKCLYTLCHIAECRLSLGISGTVEQLIELINTADNSSNLLCKEILICLCLFCQESVNRDRIRQNAGLQVIVALLNKPEYECHHPALLEALSQFIHDEIGLDILSRHGILEILVAKLAYVVAVAKSNERSSMSRKRSSNSPAENYNKPFKYPCLRRYSMDYYRDDWSPKSATSASSSPPSTPPLPPYSDSNAETDDLEDDYSPVYNDTECDNDEDEENISLKSYKSLTTIEADSDSSSSNSEISSGMNSYEYYTLLLLNRLSLCPKPIDKLAEPTTIKSLTDYIKYAEKQNVILKYRDIAVKILKRIMGNAAYFMLLLKQGLVFEVQTLPEVEDYTHHLRTVAETGGATGQLSFILLRGEEEHKLLTAVSIPLLIKTQHTLKCLLKKNGGLQLIFDLLTDSSHKLHERAIWSICQLAKTLEINPDDCSITETAINSSELCDYSRLPFDETNHMEPFVSSMVTFELDDGTTVKTCRRMLCQYSPVFSAMLEGNFSESSKKQIRLRDTSRNGLKTLILATTGAAFENRSIESLLDAVLLADKFLMPDTLTKTLTENSLLKLNYENFYRAWRWARNHSCHELKSYCVKSFLTAKMSWNETIRTFRDFYNTNVFDEFLHEIRDIITGVLCQC